MNRSRTPVAADAAPLLEDAISLVSADDFSDDESDGLEALERDARLVELTLPNIRIKIFL